MSIEIISAIQAIIALVLTVVTGVYVYLTHKLVNETTKATAKSTDPEIAIWSELNWEFQSHGLGSWDIKIQNIGKGIARNIKITTPSILNSGISSISILYPGKIETFSPRMIRKNKLDAQIERFFDETGPTYLKRNNLEIQITLEYANKGGKTFQEIIQVKDHFGMLGLSINDINKFF